MSGQLKSKELELTIHGMHLMYCLDTTGKRRYTLKKVLDGEVSKSAHPARFSPDDKYSRYERIRFLMVNSQLSARTAFLETHI